MQMARDMRIGASLRLCIYQLCITYVILVGFFTHISSEPCTDTHCSIA
jgi:hypothetical protein